MNFLREYDFFSSVGWLKKWKKKTYDPKGLSLLGTSSLFAPHSEFIALQDSCSTVTTSLLPIQTVTIPENINEKKMRVMLFFEFLLLLIFWRSTAWGYLVADKAGGDFAGEIILLIDA